MGSSARGITGGTSLAISWRSRAAAVMVMTMLRRFWSVGEQVGERARGADDGGARLHVGRERVDAVLAAPAALLEAAIGRRPAQERIGVHPDHAGLDAIRDAVRAPDVARP